MNLISISWQSIVQAPNPQGLDKGVFSAHCLTSSWCCERIPHSQMLFGEPENGPCLYTATSIPWGSGIPWSSFSKSYNQALFPQVYKGKYLQPSLPGSLRFPPANVLTAVPPTRFSEGHKSSRSSIALRRTVPEVYVYSVNPIAIAQLPGRER